jgi:glycerate kinase
VTTPFLDAARVFAPQKGATPEQVEQLSARLARLADSYQTEFGVDVTALPGAGAAGGLAGGLAALGASIVSGFELVADFVGLDDEIAKADLVMTGEGRLDRQSFSGKVVGGVISHVAGRVPVLCVVGVSAPDLDPVGFELVDLVARFGLDRALSEVLELIEQVVAEQVLRMQR